MLHRELNTEPDAETRALFQRLRTEAHQRGAELDSPHQQSLAGSVGQLRRETLEPVGGAVPLESAFYVQRPADEQFRQAIARGDSIVLVKGAREMGKTSLLARGLHAARKMGARVVHTDFQLLSLVERSSSETLLRKLARSIADQLHLETGPEEDWHPGRGHVENFKRYWRRVILPSTDAAIVWGLDGVDLLFDCGFASEIFGLFRSCHNDRAMDPEGPWRRLTLAISYATEARLFIRDDNQSPFNVGVRLTLEDFTLEQIAQLNERYGRPLRDERELKRIADLIGGHPYLVRLGLHEMVVHQSDVAAIEAEAERDDGVFGPHLRRMVGYLNREPDLCQAVQRVLIDSPCPSLGSFYRLRSAGVILGESLPDARLRCRLYARYLTRHLR
jgi:hypothetical protein